MGRMCLFTHVKIDELKSHINLRPTLRSPARAPRPGQTESTDRAPPPAALTPHPPPRRPCARRPAPAARRIDRCLPHHPPRGDRQASRRIPRICCVAATSREHALRHIILVRWDSLRDSGQRRTDEQTTRRALQFLLLRRRLGRHDQGDHHHDQVRVGSSRLHRLQSSKIRT